MYCLYPIYDLNKMSPNNSNSSEDRNITNYTAKIVIFSIAIGIVLSFLIGYVVNGGWK